MTLRNTIGKDINDEATTSAKAALGFSASLALWAADSPRVWSADVLDAAQRSIVDTVGCMLAGGREVTVARVVDSLRSWRGEGVCSVVSCHRSIDAPWAALVNGTAAHALDYDDVLEAPATHPGAVLVPALLALAEETGATGLELVDAYIVGVEVQQCLGEAFNMDHYSRGWHTTLSLGAPSAAAACARLLRLDASALLSAMSIGTSLAGGFKRQFGTDAKPLHAGLAAQHGVLAARLAASGLSADRAPFEGPHGFKDLLCGPRAADFTGVLARLKSTPAVLRPGMWLKRYPCCASAHRSVDGLLAIRQQHRIRHEDVVSISTTVSAAAFRNLPYARPADAMQARFSMPHCLAVALCDGDIKLCSFGPDVVQRPDIVATLPRVSLREDATQPPGMRASVLPSANVEVTVQGGQRFEARVVQPKGHPGQPLDEGELQRKFEDCTEGLACASRRLYADWRGVASTRAMAPLIRALRPPPI